MLQWLKRVFRQVSFEVDERGARRLEDGALIEQVVWDDLVGVDIVTTDAGPAVEDVFFVLHGKDGKGCVVPQDVAVAKALLERLQKLPDFDNGKVIEAMGSVGNARFVCWKKSPCPGASP
jgi:hypothetical protein